MKSIQRLPGWLAPIALLIPLSASATPVTWNLSGVLQTVTSASPLPSAIVPGAAYNLTVSFDSDAFNGGGGFYNNTPNTGFTFSLNLDCDDDLAGVQPCGAGPAATSGIIMTNHFNNNGTFLDIMTLTLYAGADDHYQRWRVTMVGGDDVWGPPPTAVPSDPLFPSYFFAHNLEVCSTGATSQPGGNQQLPCDPSGIRVFGTDFVPVPEPATLALLGMGVAGLGIARRRKRQV
jgi:hypothetical protein